MSHLPTPRPQICHVHTSWVEVAEADCIGTALSPLSSSAFWESFSYSQNGFWVETFLQDPPAMTLCNRSSSSWSTSLSMLYSPQVLTSLEKSPDCPILCSHVNMYIDKDTGQENKTQPLYKDCKGLETFIPYPWISVITYSQRWNITFFTVF